jgi:hypothetical protein
MSAWPRAIEGQNRGSTSEKQNFGQELLQKMELRKPRGAHGAELEASQFSIDLSTTLSYARETGTMPAFFTSPMHPTDLPRPCEAVPTLRRATCVSRLLRTSEKPLICSRQSCNCGRGSMYFKSRIDTREAEFECEFRILAWIDEVGLGARLRVPRVQGLVLSGKATIGMLMTLITSSSIGAHLRSPGLRTGTSCINSGNNNSQSF